MLHRSFLKICFFLKPSKATLDSLFWLSIVFVGHQSSSTIALATHTSNSFARFSQTSYPITLVLESGATDHINNSLFSSISTSSDLSSINIAKSYIKQSHGVGTTHPLTFLCWLCSLCWVPHLICFPLIVWPASLIELYLSLKILHIWMTTMQDGWLVPNVSSMISISSLALSHINQVKDNPLIFLCIELLRIFFGIRHWDFLLELSCPEDLHQFLLIKFWGFSLCKEAKILWKCSVFVVFCCLCL